MNQVDYFWKTSESNVIDVIEDEMNEFTLKDIKTRKTLVKYGTPGKLSSLSSHIHIITT